MQTNDMLVAGMGLLMVIGAVFAADAPKTTASSAGEWVKLFADEGWYKQQAGEEQVFRGKLEAVQPPQISTLMRNSFYRLGERTIYTGARKLPALDALVGRDVEIRGKPVDMNLEGQNLKELWPAAVRAAGALPAPTDVPLAITNADNGKTLTARVGQMIRVELDGSGANTGWEVAFNPTVLTRASLKKGGLCDEFKPAANATAPSIGLYVFLYKAVREGEEAMRFSYITPGGPNATERDKSSLAGTFEVIVKVKE